jgi:phytoene synthase
MKPPVQDVKAHKTVPRTSSLQLRAAYAVCRSIARAAAKNFYYGFLALPRYKRNALCAVYAFMRHADDISDPRSRSTATSST